jgi:endonuclease YncB( thermonuclease family)
LFVLFCLTVAAAQGQPLTVARVLDADTFVLSDGRTVRLPGLDAPAWFVSERLMQQAAAKGQSVEMIQAVGKAAHDFAAFIALGRRVQLIFDPGYASVGHRDADGFTRAYLHVVDEAGRMSFSIGERLILEGYVTVNTQYPFMYQQRYLAIQRLAAQAKRGLWNEDPFTAWQQQYRRPEQVQPPPAAGNSSGIDLLGECGTLPSCEWVTGTSGGLGMWRSKPGQQCPCAQN